jgi:hypothetical protein
MSRIRELFARRVALVAALLALVLSGESLAVGIYDYQLSRSFSLPGPNVNFSQVLYDPLPDGRLLLLNGSTVSVETAPKTGTFSTLGVIPGFNVPFGPSFLAVSPDGTRAAAGTNGGGSIAVFNTSNPTVVTNYGMQDSSGEWVDNRYLAVANFSTTSGVQVLDTTTSTVKQVIANIAGSSAGVTVDAAGNLYAANGSGSSPSGSSVGWIKEFSAAAWQNAMATSTPLNFETRGTPVVDLLSAYPIGFDTSGNLFVGGGDFFGSSGDKGYAALVDAAAVANALAIPQASPPITPASSAAVLRKLASPQGTIDNFQPPNWNYNAATGELYLNYAFGDGNVGVYVAVPEPSCTLLTVMCGMLLVTRRMPRA